MLGIAMPDIDRMEGRLNSPFVKGSVQSIVRLCVACFAVVRVEEVRDTGPAHWLQSAGPSGI